MAKVVWKVSLGHRLNDGFAFSFKSILKIHFDEKKDLDMTL